MPETITKMLEIQTNNQVPILMTRNAEDIVLLCPDSTTIEMRIESGAFSVSTELIPADGQLNIPLADILNSLECRIGFCDLNGSYGKIIDIPSVSISFTDPATGESVNWNRPVLQGGIDNQDPDTVLYSQWMTWRPQVGKLSEKAVSLLYCMIPKEIDNFRTDSLRVYTDIYTERSGKHSVLYADFPSSQLTSVVAVNTSFQQIASHPAISGLVDDDILAYDVYAALSGFYQDLNVIGEKRSTVKQRFVLSPTSSRSIGFLFRNSMGVFDDIHSSGSVKRKLNGEVTSFVASGKESIQHNAADYSYEVDTGYISSARQLAQWEDFLRSSEHYMVLDNGSISKIIIENPDTDFQLKKLGSITFSFRMAERWKGHYFKNQELDYFDYDATEL